MIIFPFVLIITPFIYPEITSIDNNFLFRSEAILYNLKLLIIEPIEYLRLDRPLHPYFLDTYQFTNQLRNITTHNAIIDFFGKTTLIGSLLFILFLNNLRKLICKINNKIFYNPIITYLWLFFCIHVSLNQIFRFNQLVILSFIIAYILVLQKKNNDHKLI